MEQHIKTVTVIKLDLIDSIKCLLGRTIKVTTNIFIPQENEIKAFNSGAFVEIVPTTTYFKRQDKPGYGYTQLEEEVKKSE